jgi:hypothetical protein
MLKPFNLPDFVVSPRTILEERDILALQDHFLKLNLGLDRSQLICEPIMDEHPIYDDEAEGRIDMYTTGTSLNRPRKYVYPWMTHAQIETYHMNRIMFFNDIEPGNVVQILPDTTGSPILDFLEIPLTVFSSGANNITWNLQHPVRPNREFWQRSFDRIRELKPRFVICRPSEIQSMLEFPIGKLECPAISTCETLLPHVRKNALNIFPRVIDKMRCWDGGLSFFECKHGTRHVNEELSIVETVAGRVVSTDIFNWFQKFIRYDNGDRCTISRTTCKCGLKGLILDSFDGKRMEALVTPDGQIITSANLMSRIARLSEQTDNRLDTFQFQIVQHVDGNAEVYFDREVGDKNRLRFGALIGYLINDDGKNNHFSVKTECRPRTKWDKQLLIKSYRKNNPPVF